MCQFGRAQCDGHLPAGPATQTAGILECWDIMREYHLGAGLESHNLSQYRESAILLLEIFR